MPPRGVYIPVADRFWPKVAKAGPDECWEWLGAHHTNGYGAIGKADGQRGMDLAHRVAYELAVGPIPAGLTIDHLCRNRGCVNPEHLEPVTMRENLLRSGGASGVNARKDACPQGHPYTHTDPKGNRRCRTCNTEQARARRAAGR